MLAAGGRLAGSSGKPGLAMPWARANLGKQANTRDKKRLRKNINEKI
jgi:hypothetical protein